MTRAESSPQTKPDLEDGLCGASPILNHRLRGTNESFMDAMLQGEALRDERCKAMIADTLKAESMIFS